MGRIETLTDRTLTAARLDFGGFTVCAAFAGAQAPIGYLT